MTDLILANRFSPAVRCSTVDGSQGQEAEVVLVDSVTMGGGANESIGFLGHEKRRYNVAMSRAKSSLIVIAHEKFIVKDNYNARGIWSHFFGVVNKRKVIIQDPMRNEPLKPELRVAVPQILANFRKGHTKNPLANPQPVPKKTVRNPRSLVAMFCDCTHATEATALEYLTAAKHELHIAIDRWCYGNQIESDDDVEDIPRLDDLTL